MGNFAGSGFSEGFARVGSVLNQADELKQQRKEQVANRVKESFDASQKATLDMFNEYVKQITEAASSGATQDQLGKLHDAAMSVLQHGALPMAQLRAQAVAGGASKDQVALLPDPEQFIQQHSLLLDATTQNALQQTPEGKARRAADAKMAEAQQIASKLGIPIEQVAQAMNLAPAPQKPMEGLDASGNPAFLQPDASGTLQRVPGGTPIPRQGMTIETTPEGGVKVTMGGAGKADKTTPATNTVLEKSILDSQDGLSRLFSIQQGFDPRFLTYAGKFENLKLSTMDKVNPGSLSAEDRKFLTDYTSFTADAIDNMNRYIKTTTGTQMSEQEAVRIRQGIPDPEKDSPTVFKAKMDANMRQLALTRARAIYSRQQGVDKPWDKYSLSQMDEIINRRADQLTAQFATQGAAGPDARKKALDVVRQEFGL